MSVQGGAGAEKADLAKALADVARELDENARAVRESTQVARQGRDALGRLTSGGGGNGSGAAGGGTGGGGIGGFPLGGTPAGVALGALGNTFIGNAAMRAGRDFAIDTTAGVAGDFTKFGFGTKGIGFSDSVTQSALRAGGSLPIVGDLFEQVTQPLDAAAGRVGGITAAIARAGGTVDPEMRKALYQRFTQEEVRARNEQNEIEKLRKSDPEALGTAMEGTRLESALQAVADNLQAITTSLGQLLANPAAGVASIATQAAMGGSR